MTQSLIIETLPTLAQFASLEVKRILKKEARHFLNTDTFVYIESDNVTYDSILLTLFSETTKKFYLFLGSWDIERESDLYKRPLEINWSNLIPPDFSFAVRPSVRERNKIGLIGKHVGQAIIDSYYRDKNVRLKVNLSNPDIEIFAWLHNNRLTLGLDLCGDNLNSNEQILARSVLLATNWDEESDFSEIIYSGVSTSALRLAIRDANRTKLKYRKFVVLPFIDKEAILEMARKSWRINKDVKIKCYDLPTRINMIKQVDPEVRKIPIYRIDELINDKSIFLASNLLLSIEKKSEQLRIWQRILGALRKNASWRRFTILAREDVLESNELSNNVDKKSIIFKGIRARIVTYVR